MEMSVVWGRASPIISVETMGVTGGVSGTVGGDNSFSASAEKHIKKNCTTWMHT